MARKAPSLPLSNMAGGINAFDQQAGENQTVDALDVFEDAGDLVRRPAFEPVGHGPFYRLPAGAGYVIHEYPLLTYTNYSDRAFAGVDCTRFGGLNGRLWFGCLEPFDGIDVRTITTVPSPTANRRIAVQYRNTSLALVPAHGVTDTTNRRESLSDNAKRYHQPLMQDGHIHWHRDQFTSWTATTLNGITRYWVALDVTENDPEWSDTSITPAAMAGTITLNFPGMRAFVSSPVNGMCAVKLRNSAPTLVIGADQSPKRGRESGASVGYKRNAMSPLEPARVSHYEGHGSIDQVTTPAWSHAGAPTGTFGSSGDLTKKDQRYSWRVDELRGATLASFSPTAGSTTTVINTTIGATLGNIENHRLWCLLNGSGSGTAIGSFVEIVSSSATTLTVYPPLNAAPDTQNVFLVQTHPLSVRTRQGKRDYDIIKNNSAGAHNAGLYFSYFSAAQATEDTQRYVHYEIGRELPWAYESGRHWSYAYNSVTGQLLMTNGNCPILAFDGIRTRELTCLSDPTDGVAGAAKVQDWNAAVEEVALTLGVDRVPVYLRSKPPIGKYIVDFHSHIVVAGLKDRENVIQWSAPGVFNDIWPNGYETQIRDGENAGVNGMWVLNNQLVVSTPAGLFASDPPDQEGRLIFHPVSRGVGFAAHSAVCAVPMDGRSVLLGPSADGIRAFNGTSNQELLDVWRRILPMGVNIRRLADSVAASSLTDTLYFLALSQAGSDSNDRLIVYDYSQQRFWVWSCPYGGISSIVCDIQESGKEIIYFGHNDGTISVLSQALQDAGSPITARARSKTATFGGNHLAFTGLMLDLRELGQSNVTIRTFLNKRRDPTQEGTLTVTFSGSTATFPLIAGADANASVFSQDDVKTMRTNLTNASHGTAFQYELSFTSQSFRLRGAALIATPKGQRHAT